MITDIEVGLAIGYRKDIQATAAAYQAVIDDVVRERDAARAEARRLTKEMQAQRVSMRIERMMRTRAELARRA